MIEVRNLTRRYGVFTAVDDVSCDIGQGEVVGLLGHNGAGKTTVMKMLTGYLDPTAGTIRIDDLAMAEARRAIQRKIGYLPENCPIYGDMTVTEYLVLRADLMGMASAERPAAVRRALAMTDMRTRAMQPIATLSRGLRQRVGVAQAILHTPSIVILDEPTNGLDPAQIQQMRRLIRELAERATVIVSTHVLSEVEAVCERVLVLNHGRLVLDAKLADLETTSALLVAVDAADAPLKKALACIDAVTRVEIVSDGTLRLATEGAWQNVAEQAARIVIEQGHALHRLQPEERSLETVFREVNEKARDAEVAYA